MAPGGDLRPTSTGKTRNVPDFQIPPKERKVISITTPNPSSNDKEDQGQARVTLSQAPTSSSPFNPDTTISSTRPNNVAAKSQDKKSTELQSISPPTLDIYAPNYIPLWLRVINDSFYVQRTCTPLKTLNYGQYVSSFAGSMFLHELPPTDLHRPQSSGTDEAMLSASNYETYWRRTLENELAQQQLQYQYFSLYEQQLELHNPRDHLFTLNVPGLRENTPRIDLGDLIHIRPLATQIPVDIHRQAAHWLKYGKLQGHIAPGFSGALFSAIVWGINRAKESVLLRIDDFKHFTRCNVVFPLQQSKTEPIFRALRYTADSLAHNEWIRKMLFPETGDGVLQTTLSHASFGLKWNDDVLNWEQKKAIHSILSTDYGSIPYLISGPPGTGKTKTLVELALQYMQQIKKRHNLLICAPSDAAADTIAIRLCDQLEPHELLRLNNWTRSFAELPDRLLPYTFSHDNLFSLPPFPQMMAYRIVVTTCRDADMLVKARMTNTDLSMLVDGLGLLITATKSANPLHWTALLLDEAAQATEPDLLVPLAVVTPPSIQEWPQFIAAGDQFQLGPNLLAKSSDLRISLFQRLFERQIYRDHPLSRRHGLVQLSSRMLPMMRPAFTNLVRNYRSHPAILSVPSMLFYNDTLIPERKISNSVLRWPGWESKLGWPVLFYQCQSEDAYESVITGNGTGTGALFNVGEAEIALRLVKSLLQHMKSSSTEHSMMEKEIMIMSPFRAQVSHLRTVFRQHGLYQVNIGPLEAFQGLESRIVIICTTRTRTGPVAPEQYVRIDQTRSLGVIDEPQRFNVAMTRAKEGLIVIGNALCLSSTGDKQWLAFLDFCRRNGCYHLDDNFQWPDLEGTYQLGQLEKALKYAKVAENSTRQGGASQDADGAKLLGKPDVHSRSVLRLRGPVKSLDEEMWQLKELVLQEDNEYVDWYVGDGPETSQIEDRFDQIDHDDDIADLSKNPLSRAEDTNHSYDRDLREEFHHECASQ